MELKKTIITVAIGVVALGGIGALQQAAHPQPAAAATKVVAKPVAAATRTPVTAWASDPRKAQAALPLMDFYQDHTEIDCLTAAVCRDLAAAVPVEMDVVMVSKLPVDDATHVIVAAWGDEAVAWIPITTAS